MEEEDGGGEEEVAAASDGPKKRKKATKSGKYLPKPKRKGKGKKGKPKVARAKSAVEKEDEECDEDEMNGIRNREVEEREGLTSEVEMRAREEELALFRSANFKDMKVKQIEKFIIERVWCFVCFSDSNF
jgi:hypothetical protein